MFNWSILLICVVFIMKCTAQDVELLARPIRPEKFVNHEELQDYLQSLKAYHEHNGHRYGKRFSPARLAKLHAKILPENWRDIYQIVKNYEEN